MCVGGGSMKAGRLVRSTTSVQHHALYALMVGGGEFWAPGWVGGGTRPWWLALLAWGVAYWPLALEPSAMTSRHPHHCGIPHCHGHPPAWVGIQNATSAHGVLP